HSDAARGPSTPSLDHLVGAGEQCRWYGESERLRSLKVDDQLDLGGLLDWQVGRLLAFENTAGVEASPAVRIGEASPLTPHPPRRQQPYHANGRLRASRGGPPAQLVDRVCSGRTHRRRRKSH